MTPEEYLKGGFPSRVMTPAEIGRPFAVVVGIDGQSVRFEADSIPNLLALRAAWEAERGAARRKSVRGEPCRSDMTPFPRRELTTEEKAVLLKRNGGRVPNGGFCVGDLPYTCPDCGGEHPCHDAACAAVDRWARGEPAFPDCPAPRVAGAK